eukprot:TRINITY_DN352_c0_g1_i1.p3 TRINITY_DN352_c0_g1~~TRINITY_DN352_c0_g1_i1.p3  ORF type:complete len:105 (+),score=4.35 TRINITY_DN352_c0_g1_i1:712-1026(+)
MTAPTASEGLSVPDNCWFLCDKVGVTAVATDGSDCCRESLIVPLSQTRPHFLLGLNRVSYLRPVGCIQIPGFSTWRTVAAVTNALLVGVREAVRLATWCSGSSY